MTSLADLCELHDIKGCASCCDIEHWEPPKAPEGKVAKRPNYGAGIVVGPERPAVTFDPQTGDHVEFRASKDQGPRPKGRPWPRREVVRDRGSKGRYIDRRPTERAAMRKVGHLTGPPITTSLDSESIAALADLRQDLS